MACLKDYPKWGWTFLMTSVQLEEASFSVGDFFECPFAPGRNRPASERQQEMVRKSSGGGDQSVGAKVRRAEIE